MTTNEPFKAKYTNLGFIFEYCLHILDALDYCFASL